MSILLRDFVFDAVNSDNIASDKTKGTVEKVQDVYIFWAHAVDVSEEDKAIAVKKAKQALATKKTGTGEDITAGDRVYGDPTDSYAVSKTKGGGYLYLGVAINDATTSDTTVLIEFDGTQWDLL